MNGGLLCREEAADKQGDSVLDKVNNMLRVSKRKKNLGKWLESTVHIQYMYCSGTNKVEASSYSALNVMGLGLISYREKGGNWMALSGYVISFLETHSRQKGKTGATRGKEVSKEL